MQKDVIPLFYPHVPESAIDRVAEVLRSRWVGQGPKVDEFERAFVQRFGVPHFASLNSGTSALRLAFALIGVGPGDEVVTTPYTAVATNTAILEQFARPVFADVDYDTVNVRADDVERRITPRTKAIVVVHWGGYPCDMREIRAVAEAHGVPVVEDAAHALGASYEGKPIGTISEFTTWSFQAIKHITTGDGGGLTARDPEKHREAIRRRWFGIDRAARKPHVLGNDPEADIVEPGFKFHMNDLAAAIGIAQLERFDEVFERRRRVAAAYDKAFQGLPGIRTLRRDPTRVCANWMYALHVEERLAFARHMRGAGVEVSVHNWRNDRYAVFGGLRPDLPGTARVDADLICLPLHHKLEDHDVERVVAAVRAFAEGSR